MSYGNRTLLGSRESGDEAKYLHVTLKLEPARATDFLRMLNYKVSKRTSKIPCTVLLFFAQNLDRYLKRTIEI